MSGAAGDVERTPIATRPAGPLRVLMLPDYRRDNPYQSLLAESLKQVGIEVEFPSGYRRGLPIFRAVRDHWPIDVLHLHWTEAYTRGKSLAAYQCYWRKLLLDLRAVNWLGVKIVWTLHNVLPHECRWPNSERRFRLRVAQRSARVIAHGSSSRQMALEHYRCPEAKIAVIPHGHYRDAYPPATAGLRLEARQGIPDSERVFLFFGMMRPYKGLERLLRIWKSLAPQSARLHLVGPCPDADYAVQLKRLSDEAPAVSFRSGFVPHAEIARVFAGADVLVLPFDKVQTSGSVILAMSYGKPVIAPSMGEIPEAVGTADDLLYEPGADDALAAAIKRAMSIDLADLSRRSESSCDRLNWSAIAGQTAAVYAAAAAGST